MAWPWWLTAARLSLFTGEGQYGKVYTCINVDTGELMAMKEVGARPCGLCVQDTRNKACVHELRAGPSAPPGHLFRRLKR